MLAGAALFVQAQTPPDPSKEGPYPVGVTTTVIVDSTRTDRFTEKPRTLVTEIWYPATDEARNMPKNRFHDFFPGGITPEVAAVIQASYHLSADELDKIFWNNSVRDAPVRAGRFPLVIFGHGNGGSRQQNTFWCDYLASHGYIVVSPDHTGNSRHAIIDGQLIRYQSKERAHSTEDRPKDMSKLLDEMILWDKGKSDDKQAKRFAGHIDTAHSAVSGMSLGSYCAVQAADADTRFAAMVGMAAAPSKHTNLTIPSLYFLGRKDGTIGQIGNMMIKNVYEAHSGPSMLLELINGGHYSFTDMFKLSHSFGDGIGEAFTPMETTYAIVNSYSTAFLGYFLKGQKAYGKYLEGNPWPNELAIQRKGF